MLDLRGAIERLHRQGRRLVLARVTPPQYRVIIDCGIDRTMNIGNICPDLEFAVARGIDLLEAEVEPVAGSGPIIGS